MPDVDFNIFRKKSDGQPSGVDFNIFRKIQPSIDFSTSAPGNLPDASAVPNLTGQSESAIGSFNKWLNDWAGSPTPGFELGNMDPRSIPEGVAKLAIKLPAQIFHSIIKNPEEGAANLLSYPFQAGGNLATAAGIPTQTIPLGEYVKALQEGRLEGIHPTEKISPEQQREFYRQNPDAFLMDIAALAGAAKMIKARAALPSLKMAAEEAPKEVPVRAANELVKAEAEATKSGILNAEITSEKPGALHSATERGNMPEKIVFGDTMPGLKEAVEKGKNKEAQQFAGQGGIDKSMEPSPGEPVGIGHIRQFFEKNLDIPIRTGRLGNLGRDAKKARGISKGHEGVIRMKDWGDVPALSHEVAHELDRQYGLNAFYEPFADELGKLDYEPGKARPNEGFSEYIRHYLTRSADPSIMAPGFDKAFRTALDQNPRLKGILEGGQGLIDRWRQQGAESRVKAAMVTDNPGIFSGIKDKLKSAGDWYLDHFDDALTPLRQFTRAAEKEAGHKFRGAESAFDMATALKGTSAEKAKEWFENGVTDFDGNVIAPSLREAFRPVKGKEWEALEYAYARHAIERWKYGKNPGIDLADAEYLVNKKGSPEFEKFTKDFSGYRDKVLQYVVDAGGLDPKTAQTFREMYEFSQPLFRAGFEPSKLGPSVGKGYGDLPNPYKKAIGSGREVINPLAGMLQETQKMIDFADRVRVGSLIAEASEKYGNLGKWIEEVPLSAKATKINTADIIKKFEDAGVEFDLSGANLDKLMTFWSQQAKGLPTENILTFYRDGKLHAYQLDKRLYDAVKQINPSMVGGFWKLFTYPKKMVAAGATGYRASFGLLTNLLRDVHTAFMQTENKYSTQIRPLTGTIRMASEKLGLGSPAEVKLWLRLGGDTGTFFKSELPSAIEKAKTFIKDNRKNKTANIVSHPIELYKEILNTPEQGPRAKEFTDTYRRVLKETGDHRSAWIEGINASKEVTMNFGRMGKYAQIANQFIPFFNPTIQEPGLIVRTFKRRPVQTLVKGFAGLTVPTIALYELNKDEDWYKALPAWQKATFWHFELGKDDKGAPRIWKLPKPFLWGAIFASGPEAVLDAYEKKNPEIVKDFLSQTVKSTVPSILPAAIGPTIDVTRGESGWDAFRDRPIVSQTEVEKLPPHERYGRFTTETAKWIGDVLNVAPKKVDYWISGQSGGLGLDIIQAIESVMTHKPSKSGLENAPFLSRIVSRSPYLGYFYDQRDKLMQQEKEINLIPAGERTEEQKNALEELKRLDNYAATLTTIRKTLVGLSRDISIPKERKEQLNKQLEDLSEQIAHESLFPVGKVSVDMELRKTIGKYGN